MLVFLLELVGPTTIANATTVEQPFSFITNGTQIFSAVFVTAGICIAVYKYFQKLHKLKEKEYKKKYEEAVKENKELKEQDRRNELTFITERLDKISERQNELSKKIDSLENVYVKKDLFLELKREIVHFKQRESNDHNHSIEALVRVICKLNEVIKEQNRNNDFKIEKIDTVNLDLSKREIKFVE